MAYFVFDLIAHTLVALASLVLLSKIDLDSIYNLSKKTAIAENQLKICASIDSGFKNIADAFMEVKTLTESDKTASLEMVHGSIESWKRQHPNLELNNCDIRYKNRTYLPEAYRLDNIDSPNRKFNWSSRIQRKED